MEIETLNIDDLNKANVYISVNKYCELKNISKTTFWRLRKQKKILEKIVKIKNYGKTLFVVIEKTKYFIDDNHNIIIIKVKGQNHDEND